jgi:hypothetical protein
VFFREGNRFLPTVVKQQGWNLLHQASRTKFIACLERLTPPSQNLLVCQRRCFSDKPSLHSSQPRSKRGSKDTSEPWCSKHTGLLEAEACTHTRIYMSSLSASLSPVPQFQATLTILLFPKHQATTISGLCPTHAVRGVPCEYQSSQPHAMKFHLTRKPSTRFFRLLLQSQGRLL